jgi:hypothetical protein
MKNQLQALLASLMAVAGIVVAAQSEDTATAADYSVFTSWGDPDLQGTWSYASLTPLQRPLRLEEKEFYPDAEAADINAQVVRERPLTPGVVGDYNIVWYDRGSVSSDLRTSLILDPVDGDYAWHQDGVNGEAIAAPSDDAQRWQLDMWINPHGFLKAAMLPGANPRASWRWELGEMGRDGATVNPEKMAVVSITVMGKYRVDATINAQNLLQRIHTWVPDPVLGDTNYEHEFSNDSYIDLGDGIRFPTVWHSHTGWDDNYQTQSINAGHNAYGGQQRNIQANVCSDPVTVPAIVRRVSFPVQINIEELAEGVWLFGGGSHNSVVVEFDNYIAVVEAPLNERRNLAVLDEIVKLIPDKPVRFLINTHQHPSTP